jgi:hypothetical protein
VIKALTFLATARQASVTRDTLLLYASELQELREDDVSVAIRQIATAPREEGQTAFPDLGTLLRKVQAEKHRRERHERDEEQAWEENERRRDRVLHPERWFNAQQITDGIVEQLKESARRKGLDWTKPYEKQPYVPYGEEF